MKKFWDGLKYSSEFLYFTDESGKLIEPEEAGYRLYDSDLFPFIVFADELQSLNDYCCRIVEAVEQELDEWSESCTEVMENGVKQPGLFTEQEFLFGIEYEKHKWEWISGITSAHLVILLYSYLEKTVKYIYKFLKQSNIVLQKQALKRPYLYSMLYNIFGKSEKEFRAEYTDIFNILEECRKIRNRFAHDNLEGAERNEEEDYIYEVRKLEPVFRLIDFISAITDILYKIESVYERAVP